VHYKFRKSKFETARKGKWWKVGINDIILYNSSYLRLTSKLDLNKGKCNQIGELLYVLHMPVFVNDFSDVTRLALKM